MTKTKKLTLSAILCALGVALMAMGSFIDILDLSVCAVVSLIVVFVYLEVGMSYAFGVYIVTSLLSLLIVPSKLIFVEYFLLFGIYPLLKALTEKLPRPTWLPIKLLFFNGIIWLVILVFEFLFGVPFIEGDTLILKIGFYLLLNVTFVVYDIFITVMVRFYYEKLRKRFKSFLK